MTEGGGKAGTADSVLGWVGGLGSGVLVFSALCVPLACVPSLPLHCPPNFFPLFQAASYCLLIPESLSTSWNPGCTHPLQMHIQPFRDVP